MHVVREDAVLHGVEAQAGQQQVLQQENKLDANVECQGPAWIRMDCKSIHQALVRRLVQCSNSTWS